MITLDAETFEKWSNRRKRRNNTDSQSAAPIKLDDATFEKWSNEKHTKDNINAWIARTNELIIDTNNHVSTWNNDVIKDTEITSRAADLLEVADHWYLQYAGNTEGQELVNSVKSALSNVGEYVKSYRSYYSPFTTSEEHDKAVEQGYRPSLYYGQLAGVVRDTDVVQTELDQTRSELNQLEGEEPTALYDALTWQSQIGEDVPMLGPDFSETAADEVATHGQDVLGKKTELQEDIQLLENERYWSEYVAYMSSQIEENFDHTSQYIGRFGAGEIAHDVTYEYINDQNGFRAAYNDQETTLEGNGYEYMLPDEVKVYNHLYATQGKESANEFLEFLSTTLTAREREEYEGKVTAFIQENPVWGSIGMSAATILLSPLKGFEYIGQGIDYLADGKIDQNASYNRISHFTNATRAAVSEQIEKSGNWGVVGSFAYETGMGLGDFLISTAVSGSNPNLALAIMGTGAAADTTIAAKDRGLSDGQAFALGTIAGAAEIITEKIGLDAMFDAALKGKSRFKYFLKNALGEAVEEPTSSLINCMADIYIAGDKSQFEQSVKMYMEEGLTESEAFVKATVDLAMSLGLDTLGGLASGGIIGGVSLGIDYVRNSSAKNTAKQNDIQAINTMGNVPLTVGNTVPAQIENDGNLPALEAQDSLELSDESTVDSPMLLQTAPQNDVVLSGDNSAELTTRQALELAVNSMEKGKTDIKTYRALSSYKKQLEQYNRTNKLLDEERGKLQTEKTEKNIRRLEEKLKQKDIKLQAAEQNPILQAQAEKIRSQAQEQAVENNREKALDFSRTFGRIKTDSNIAQDASIQGQSAADQTEMLTRQDLLDRIAEFVDEASLPAYLQKEMSAYHQLKQDISDLEASRSTHENPAELESQITAAKEKLAKKEKSRKITTVVNRVKQSIYREYVSDATEKFKLQDDLTAHQAELCKLLEKTAENDGQDSAFYEELIEKCEAEIAQTEEKLQKVEKDLAKSKATTSAIIDPGDRAGMLFDDRNIVSFQGRQVVLDEGITLSTVDEDGRTNKERVAQGRVPILAKGKRANLHHLDQSDDGIILVLSESLHNKYDGMLHANKGQAPSKVDRKAFAKWRKLFWQWIIQQLTE